MTRFLMSRSARSFCARHVLRADPVENVESLDVSRHYSPPSGREAINSLMCFAIDSHFGRFRNTIFFADVFCLQYHPTPRRQFRLTLNHPRRWRGGLACWTTFGTKRKGLVPSTLIHGRLVKRYDLAMQTARSVAEFSSVPHRSFGVMWWRWSPLFRPLR